MKNSIISDQSYYNLILAQVNCMLCNSGTEALHLLDKFESSLEYLIIVSYDVKVEEVKSRHGSKVSVYLFEDFLVSTLKNTPLTSRHINVKN